MYLLSIIASFKIRKYCIFIIVSINYLAQIDNYRLFKVNFLETKLLIKIIVSDILKEEYFIRAYMKDNFFSAQMKDSK